MYNCSGQLSQEHYNILCPLMVSLKFNDIWTI